MEPADLLAAEQLAPADGLGEVEAEVVGDEALEDEDGPPPPEPPVEELPPAVEVQRGDDDEGVEEMLPPPDVGISIPVDPPVQQMSVDEPKESAGQETPDGSTAEARWDPVGGEDALRWKRRKTDRSERADSAQPDREVFQVFLQQVEAAIDPLIKKQMDREVPFDKIPRHQVSDYALAE